MDRPTLRITKSILTDAVKELKNDYYVCGDFERNGGNISYVISTAGYKLANVLFDIISRKINEEVLSFKKNYKTRYKSFVVNFDELREALNYFTLAINSDTNIVNSIMKYSPGMSVKFCGNFNEGDTSFRNKVPGSIIVDKNMESFTPTFRVQGYLEIYDSPTNAKSYLELMAKNLSYCNLLVDEAGHLIINISTGYN